MPVYPSNNTPHEFPISPFRGPATPAAWPGEGPQAPGWSEPAGVPWARYLDALKRHLVLIIGLTVIGSLLGVVAARRVKPEYEAQTTIWVNGANSQQASPIKTQQLLPSASWVDLLRSYTIVDGVVLRLNLNLSYKQRRDSVLFRDFSSVVGVHPGSYVLLVDSSAQHFVLSRANGAPLERGTLGDTIGLKEGFSWLPAPALLKPGQSVEFSVATPRGVSTGLVGAVRATLPENGQLLRISLSGSDPQRTARTLNAWVDQFVASSIDLKKRHLLQFKQILADQLSVAEQQLRAAESELEGFRVNTITLPSAPTSTAAPPGGVGRATTPSPVTADYFQQKATLEDIRSDRIALERIIADSKEGSINPQAFLMLPSILNNTPQLRTAIEELSARQAALRTEQQYLTDANPRIKQLVEAVRVLEQETIPRITLSVLASLRAREPEVSTRIDQESRELRAIPSRSTEEMRLARRLAATENLYNTLKARYEEVSISDAGTAPDLNVLDLAVPPLFPTSNEAPRLLLLAVLASFGFAVGVALLHDRFDRRFRYPEQATHELGLLIAGTVPKFKANRRGEFGIETLSAAVEAFRSLRLALTYDFPADAPIVLGVSSPAAGDGKSLVSANLALAFSNAGSRTLLIDGDIRCGTVHTTFNVPVTPGLVEHLHGVASMESILRSTSSENLFVIARGTRRTRAPELLVSELMRHLVLTMRERFDVVIIDSPPLVAGMDAYALGAAAGSMLIVLRPAVTDRKLAAAKLEVLDRLPIRILGAVVNAVPNGGSYEYYGSDYGYGGYHTSDPGADLATPGGLVLQA